MQYFEFLHLILEVIIRTKVKKAIRECLHFQQLFWAGLITVAYLPSTVFPTGPSAEGLPLGLQAVGAEYADRTCIDFARLLADEIGGFVPPPGY